MSHDSTAAGPFEILGLLANADRDDIERRAESLSSMLKLGLEPPEGDAVALPEGFERTAEEVSEAARLLRDPERWLREVVLWPEGIASNEALALAADLLEGAAGKPIEPGSLVRQLAQEYLSEEVRQASPTDQPQRWIDRLLAPPSEPELYIGVPETRRGGSNGSNDG